jgi:hypothetical protein
MKLFVKNHPTKILIALFPFMKPTASESEYFGGTERTKWIWSTWMLPSRISIFFHSHSCRIMSRMERPISPRKILNRYFGHQTTWYLHSHTACDNLLNRFTEYLLFTLRVPYPYLKGGIFFCNSLWIPHSKAWTISVADGLRD